MLKNKNKEFTENYTKYYPLIFGFIYKKLFDFDIANDLVQEVFINFFSNMEKVNNPKYWLFGTAQNLLCHHYRKEKKTVYDTPISEESGYSDRSFNNESQETRFILDEAIDAISGSENRDLFNLVAVHEYTYEKAGKQLGLSLRQVKYRYNLIIRDLLHFLRKKEIRTINDIL
ncbi:MAG: RNA polymerase sigma factor [bacterium]|nr:RNA polymerase sigma factor [bacterium]